MNYYWARVFTNDGVLLHETYYTGENLTRSDAKKKAAMEYGVTKFAKNKTNENYCNIMESSKFFYERFMVEVDTICFNCHKPINGKLKNFPRYYPGEINAEYDEYYICCSYDCKRMVSDKLNPIYEGCEFQEKESEGSGRVFGYIYHVYNRAENKHYIGQTRFLPFFRWQEHIKNKRFGENITSLEFEVITEVTVQSQIYLNGIEGYWIKRFIEDCGIDHVYNISNPKITIEDLKAEFEKQISFKLEGQH